MLQLRIWPMGSLWRVEVVDDALNSDFPEEIFTEMVSNEVDLQRASGEALAELKKAKAWRDGFDT